MAENIITKSERTSGGSSQKYIVATAFLSLFAIVGIALYGLPFFYDFWEGAYGWSRTTITSGNALGKLLVAPLFGFIAGWMIDRYGPRKLMITGVLMAGMALIGLSLQGGSLTLFYTFYILNALGYVLAGPLPCQVLISRWFDKNRGKAMGIAYLGIGTGGTLVPFLANGFESRFGWQMALVALGALMIIIALPMVFFIKDRADSTNNEPKKVSPISIGAILKNRYFYLLLFGSMISIGVDGGVNQNLKLYLSDLGFTQENARNIISLVLLSSLVGRVATGWLADLFPRKYVMVFLNLLVISSISLLIVPDFSGRLIVFSIVFGIGLGGDYLIIPLMAGDLFGVRVLGRVMGIILVADGIAEALFPMGLATIYDNAGSYTPAFAILMCIGLAGAFLISLLPKKKSD
jgi:MFS family permease